jgi:hypothetical protein
MAGLSGMRIVDGIGPRLLVLGGEVEHRLHEEVLNVAIEALDYAKENAPWADRTGDARVGLDTSVELEGHVIVWQMYHTVEYGQWLETIQNGKFAIILPTLEIYAPKVGRGLSEG